MKNRDFKFQLNNGAPLNVTISEGNQEGLMKNIDSRKEEQKDEDLNDVEFPSEFERLSQEIHRKKKQRL